MTRIAATLTALMLSACAAKPDGPIESEPIVASVAPPPQIVESVDMQEVHVGYPVVVAQIKFKDGTRCVTVTYSHPVISCDFPKARPE